MDKIGNSILVIILGLEGIFMKGISSLIWILMAVVGIAVLSNSGINFNLGSTIGTGFSPEYPANPFNKIFNPVWGQIDCKSGGVKTSSATYTMNKNGDWATYSWTCNNIGNYCYIAKVDSVCPERKDAIFGNLYKYTTTEITINGRSASVGSSFSIGETAIIRVQCVYTALLLESPYSAPNAFVQFSADQYKLYVTSHGYTAGGYMDGTENCKLIGESATKLKDAQPSEATFIEQFLGIKLNNVNIGDNIPPLTTKNVIVGWREDPTFGNMNPSGKYNGQDVLCIPYNGLYNVKTVGTNGGVTYYMKGSVLKTYSQDNTLCCDNTNAPTGYYCENYKMSQKPSTCTKGSCAWSADQCGVQGTCVDDGTNYYIKTFSCVNGCCEEKREYQKCCLATCDRVSTASDKYYCNPQVGCVKISTDLECGNGYCCNVNGVGKQWSDASKSPYKTQGCTLTDLKCCYSNVNDVYRGTCMKDCTVSIHCGNEKCEAELGEDKTTCPVDCAPTDCQASCEKKAIWERPFCQLGCWWDNQLKNLGKVFLIGILFIGGFFLLRWLFNRRK
jgi:hypothetical protein